MEFAEKRKKQYKLIEDDKSTIIDSLNQQKIELRSKKNNLKLIVKRKSKLEQIKSDFNNIKGENQFHINNFESSFNTIISFLNSSDKNLVNYCLNELCIYFKYNEPNFVEQKMISERQFFEILLKLGNIFLHEKNENNLILIIWILINIQIHNEGNDDYLSMIYNDKYFDFYNECYKKSGSDEIMNELIILLTYMTKIDGDINIKILQSKVFDSIINCALNKNQDMDTIEMIIQLIANCLKISNNCELHENEIDIINNCIIILKNELNNLGNDKIQKLCYEGLYKISKINNKYKFNEKLIKEEIPIQIMKLKLNNSNTTLLYALKIFGNILTVSDKYCKIIYENNVIEFYNNVLNKFDNDSKFVNIILNCIFNISVSKYRNIIKSSIIWTNEKIQKYFNMNDKIKLIFIKIVKYMVINGALIFIYNTKILEYLIYLLSNSNLCEKVSIKILKVVDIYLKKFNNFEKENIEYYIIYNKFKDLFNSSEKIHNNNYINNNIIESIDKNIINNYQ